MKVVFFEKKNVYLKVEKYVREANRRLCRSLQNKTSQCFFFGEMKKDQFHHHNFSSQVPATKNLQLDAYF